VKPLPAGRHLVWLRIAVAGRPALDDIGDVDLFAPQLDRLDDPREKLAGRSDKRQSLTVLLGSRPPAPKTTFRRPSAKRQRVQVAAAAACAASVPGGSPALGDGEANSAAAADSPAAGELPSRRSS
jgi:hypothetical protein